MKTVYICVEGGVIQDIWCPAGVQLQVRDYDVDSEESITYEDGNGNECNISLYGSSGQESPDSSWTDNAPVTYDSSLDEDE